MTGVKERSYAVLGTGALGGLYGGLLAAAGFEVHFLMRSDFAHVQRHGLRVDSPWGDIQLSQPQVYSSPKDMPQVDVAIVAWKTVSNAALKASLNAVCGPETIVLVLQNGLNVEQDSACIVGEDRVLGGCCFLCSNKVGPGHIRHLDYGAIVFGEYGRKFQGQITARMQAIENDFRKANIDMRPASSLLQTRWKKLVWNIPFNGLSVVLGADTRQIMEDPSSARLAETLMVEVQLAAAAVAVEIPSEHIKKMLSDTRNMVPYHSSMSLDYQAKRPMEVEAIFGNPVRVAIEAGYRPAKIEMLYEQLCFLDRLNRAG